MPFKRIAIALRRAVLREAQAARRSMNRAGLASRGNTVAFGEYGLMALEPCWLTSRQIEAARIAITRHVKRAGKLWIRVFPDKPITKKPLETRMGHGKGNVEEWVAVVQRGRVAYERLGFQVQPRGHHARLGRQRDPPAKHRPVFRLRLPDPDCPREGRRQDAPRDPPDQRDLPRQDC